MLHQLATKINTPTFYSRGLIIQEKQWIPLTQQNHQKIDDTKRRKNEKHS